MLRSARTGRARPWVLQRGAQRRTVEPKVRLWLSDPEAVSDAAGYGIALAALTHVHAHLASGALVRRLPHWWADAGTVSVYFAPSRLMPAKTRAFVDDVVGALERDGLARRISASGSRADR